MNFNFRLDNFSLYDTLYCGQCFRFEELNENKFLIFAGKESAFVSQKGNFLFFEKSSCCSNFWKRYFNIDIDYTELLEKFKKDSVLLKVIKKCSGIRILKQNPFETLISFILSINNNIVRIKNIIKILCENFGRKNKNGYSFPTIDDLKSCSEQDFFILRAGFRVKYLVDAIFKIKTNKINLNELYFLDFETAKEKLKRIKGVGEKVSSCVLLFAYNKMESFPVDVWIKKVLNQYYKEGVSEEILSCPGLAQQLLFYGKRKGFI